MRDLRKGVKPPLHNFFYYCIFSLKYHYKLIGDCIKFLMKYYLTVLHHAHTINEMTHVAMYLGWLSINYNQHLIAYQILV